MVTTKQVAQADRGALEKGKHRRTYALGAKMNDRDLYLERESVMKELGYEIDGVEAAIVETLKYIIHNE